MKPNHIDLQFPVIIFDKIYGLPDLRTDWESLLTAGPGWIRSGAYDGMLVIDSRGQGVWVRHPKMVRNFKWFLGLILLWGFRGPFEAVFEGPPFMVPLEEVKARVDRFLQSDEYVIGGYGKLRKQIESCASLREIMRLLLQHKIVNEEWCGKGLRQMLEM